MTKLAPISTVLDNDINIKSKGTDRKHGGGGDGGSYPSPISPDTAKSLLDQLLHQQEHFYKIPEPDTPLSDEDRTCLLKELDDLKELSRKVEDRHNTEHAHIQQYQQDVLSTHAQVAIAKKELLQARQQGFSISISTSDSTSSFASFMSSSDREHGESGHSRDYHPLHSNASSRASSPPLSPIHMDSTHDIPWKEIDLKKLEARHRRRTITLVTGESNSRRGQETTQGWTCCDQGTDQGD